MKRKTLTILILSLSAISSFGQSSWLWGRGNTGGNMDSWAVATDLYGYIYAAGVSTSNTVYFGADSIYFPFSSSSGIAMTTIVKYDPNGNTIWAKGITSGNSLPINITTDAWGNLIMLGIFYDHITIDTQNLYVNPYDTCEYFVAKLDSSGNTLWAITSGQSSYSNALFTSTAGDCEFVSWGGITTDIAGNIYVTGNFNDIKMVVGNDTLVNQDPSDTTDDVFVAKYDSSGNQVWATSFGGNYNDDVLGITVASTGNVFVSGTTASDAIIAGPDTLRNTTGVQIAFIAELSPSGNLIWGEEAGGRNGAYGASLQSDHAGNVFMVGAFGDSTLIFGTDTIYRTYPAGVPNLETYLVKFSDSNKVTWQKTIGSPSCSIIGFCLAQGNTEAGTLWVSGAWSSNLTTSYLVIDSANIDGQKLYTPDSSIDPVFIAGYNWSGEVIGYAALQSGADDQNGIACDAANNVYMCSDYIVNDVLGYFYVGPDTLVCNTSFGAAERQYLAKYGLTPTLVNHVSQYDEITICPNPATNLLEINSNNIITGIIIYDLPGREICNRTYNSNQVQLNIDNLSPGIYFIRINGTVVKKFIKQ